MDKDKDKEWDQLPDYLEAVRRERRPGDPTEYGYYVKQHSNEDRTDFIVGQAHWTCENLPNILYTIKQPETQRMWGSKTPTLFKLDAHGQSVTERWPSTEPPDQDQVHRLRDIPVLPDQICYYEKWWRIEAWRRLDPRITINDIVMRQMPPGGIRVRAVSAEAKRLLGLRKHYLKRFHMLDWYTGNARGDRVNDKICTHFQLKQLQENCSRGLTPGLIYPARGNIPGNRIPLPTFHNPSIEPPTFNQAPSHWKLNPLYVEPNSNSLTVGSSKEHQNVVDLCEDEASPSPKAKRDTSEIQILRVGKSQIAKMLRPLEYNQHNESDGDAIRQVGEAKKENEDRKDLHLDETSNALTRSQRTNTDVNGVKPESDVATRSPSVAVSEAPKEDQDLDQARANAPVLARRKRSQKLLVGSERDSQEGKYIGRSPSIVTISSGAEKVADQVQVAAALTRSARGIRPKYNLRKRVTTNHNRLRSGSSPLFFSSEDESEIGQSQRPVTRSVLQARKARKSRLSFSDTDEDKFLPSTDTASDTNDEIADARPSAKRPRRGSVQPMERISTEPNRERSIEVRVDSLNADIKMKDTPLITSDEPSSTNNDEVDHSTIKVEPSSLGNTEVDHSTTTKGKPSSTINANVEHSSPMEEPSSTNNGEVDHSTIKAEPSSLGKTEADHSNPIKREPTSTSNGKVGLDIPMAEPRSITSADVDNCSLGKDVVIDETRPSPPVPSHGTQNSSGIFMALVEELIGIKSRISGLELRESSTSKALGEQVDKVAKTAIELRAGSDRLLDEIASLRETVDQLDGQR